MLADGTTVAVLIPAYNEGRQIEGVIRSLPETVDHVVVVDDASTDDTSAVVRAVQQNDDRVTLFQLEENLGVGGALAVAYRWARDNGVGIAVSMDGDGQMDPEDLDRMVEPIVAGRADYTKGNRLTRLEDVRRIPRLRLFGNITLSVLTKVASGYWTIADSQSGYSAAGRYALDHIDWDRMYRRYGRPNDVICLASIAGCRAADVPIRSLYGVGEVSSMKILRTSVGISGLLLRRFFQRLWLKHVLIDFHPMVFLYAVWLLAGVLAVALMPWVVLRFVDTGQFPQLASFTMLIAAATSANALALALFMDLYANRSISLPLQVPAGQRSRSVTGSVDAPAPVPRSARDPLAEDVPEADRPRSSLG